MLEKGRLVRVTLTGYVDTFVVGDQEIEGVLDLVEESVKEGLGPGTMKALSLELSRVDVLPERVNTGVFTDFKKKGQAVRDG